MATHTPARPHLATSRTLAVAALSCLFALGAPSAALAQSHNYSLAISAADGQKDVRKIGLIWAATRAQPLWQGQNWQLQLRHEAELAAWHVRDARNIIELGYSPVFRLQRPWAGKGQRSFYMEGGIGVRGISHTRTSAERTMSTAFQFSDMAGIGWQWGAQNQHNLGLRVQHLSNAGIKRPNPGINFGQVYYSRAF